MRILLYPHGNDSRYNISKVSRYFKTLGIEKVTNPNEDYDHAILWSFDTVTPLDVFSKIGIVKNIGAHDASKIKVERIMKDVFGYNTLIASEGFCLKSNDQGTHDITITNKLACKLIDNRQGDYYVDYRLYIFAGHIAYLWITNKSEVTRFQGNRGAVFNIGTTNIGKYFTNEEQLKILQFCWEYGLEFTELDIIRDQTGKMYIVDQNNIAGFMASQYYRDINEKEFFSILTEAFRCMILSW